MSHLNFINRSLYCLMYADDIVLFAQSWKGLLQLLKIMLECVLEIDMEVNCAKTKCMMFNLAKTEHRFLSIASNFKLGLKDIVFCDIFVYLDHTLENHLDDKEDVNREIHLSKLRFITAHR
jgi:hypothetical protein